ncbi:MAG: ABC transporter ATP-binding protein [Alphaproteobacteria bacterium]|nr:ABC transporter ATP-binding protein [Alphaproteobacteria bacterium]
MSPPVLAIRDLSVAYRSRRGRLAALRHVDIEVAANRIVGIVGESGCGKSTLIAAVLGLLAPNAEVMSGTVGFEGRNLLAATPAELRAVRGPRIATIFQDPMTALNPVLSIATQMIDIQYRSDEGATAKRARAIAMLTRVGIPDAAQRIDDYAHRFSGGMRQRIVIGMALLMRPALLIADEPTTALDVTLEAQIVHLLREMRGEIAGSILFVSHNLGLIAELCDEVVVMYAGEVVERAPVRALFHAPQHPYTRLLLACDPARVAEGTFPLPTIPGGLPDLAALPQGCVFRARCPDARAECATPPPLRNIGAGHVARCVRAGDG